MRTILSRILPLTCLLISASNTLAHEGDLEELPESVIIGKATNLLGIANSASVGIADNEELSHRPTLRRGELLEVIPGFISTQHSGGGKANQYFVRGFNLDHGTDFSVAINGMPGNFRTHSHGQGYADVNFIVPEFVERLDYFKGPFNTSFGDLSTAGGANYRLYNVLPEGQLSLTHGQNNYARMLLSDTKNLGKGVLSMGLEYTHEDGPWLRGNGYQRYNIFTRYHEGDDNNFWNLTLLGHTGVWDSSDQKPSRALASGSLDRFGTVDPTTGGDTSRFSLSSQIQRRDLNKTTHMSAWLGYYELDLFSNFTYNLNNPIMGDQFEQSESRVFAGVDLWQRHDYQIAKFESNTTIGFQTRNDWINDIGLYNTQARKRYETVRQDDVYVGSYSLYLNHETAFNDWFRAGFGLRGDLFHFDVKSDLAANSGSETAGIISPKINFAFGPWNHTEVYMNAGYGFHSNDARGVTIAIDPTDGITPLNSVNPLVRTRGAEIGIRSHTHETLTGTLSLWALESDSELVYVGDAGVSEAGDASKRWGIEAAVYWRPVDWFTADAEYSWSDAKFVNVAPGFDSIPNSVEHTLSTGVTIGKRQGWFSSVRGKFFSARPLEETGNIKSQSSFTVNSRIGYRKLDWEISLDVLNLLDSHDRDIEYYYDSRLPGEAGSISDIHYQPNEPRQIRLNFTRKF